jgi:2-dehydropantoate 2-reductase
MPPCPSPREPFRLRRIAIIGAGPMGTSLAALTSAQVPTVLVDRHPQRAQRIRTAGIELDGALRAHGRPDVVASVDDLAEIHPIDLVFIATKTTALAAVCDALQPHRAELPYLVSYQNGIEPGRAIVQRLGTPRVLRMVLRYGAGFAEDDAAEGPLRVRVGLHDPPHFVGGEGEALAFAGWLAPRIAAMGLPIQATPDIEREAWRKGIENAAGNAVAALARAPLGELLDSPGRGLIERLLDEGIAVARAAGIEIEPGFREHALLAMAAGRGHLPSMAQDVLAGRPTEVEQLNEQIRRRGRELGVPTPTHEAVLDLLRIFDWRATQRRSTS